MYLRKVKFHAPALSEFKVSDFFCNFAFKYAHMQTKKTVQCK